MPLEARVKQDYFMKAVTAFSGREYLKSEWRIVPEQFEQQARTHEMLEVRELTDAGILSTNGTISVLPYVEPETKEELTMEEPALKSTRKTHRKTSKQIEADE